MTAFRLDCNIFHAERLKKKIQVDTFVYGGKGRIIGNLSFFSFKNRHNNMITV